MTQNLENLTMAEFSLNTEFENFIKATLKDQEHLKQVEETITLLDENKNESSKSADFFQDNNAIKKKTFSKNSTQKIFYQTFPILE